MPGRAGGVGRRRAGAVARHRRHRRDRISVGALTRDVKAVDLSMRIIAEDLNSAGRCYSAPSASGNRRDPAHLRAMSADFVPIDPELPRARRLRGGRDPSHAAKRFPQLATPELLADIACVALNRLPPRYIRHEVDFCLLPHRQGARRQRAHGGRCVCSSPSEFVQARKAMKARASVRSIGLSGRSIPRRD